MAKMREALMKLELVTEDWGCGWAGEYTQKNVVDLLVQLVPEVCVVSASRSRLLREALSVCLQYNALRES